jgi:hypothetical protein
MRSLPNETVVSCTAVLSLRLMDIDNGVALVGGLPKRKRRKCFDDFNANENDMMLKYLTSLCVAVTIFVVSLNLLTQPS